jgi:F0F1-type ATP synthase gamma subunit
MTDTSDLNKMKNDINTYLDWVKQRYQDMLDQYRQHLSQSLDWFKQMCHNQVDQYKEHKIKEIIVSYNQSYQNILNESQQMLEKLKNQIQWSSSDEYKMFLIRQLEREENRLPVKINKLKKYTELSIKSILNI